MILRDLATAWVRENCPRVEVQEDVLRQLDAALQQVVGCSFIIGRALTRWAGSVLVAGEMASSGGY